MSNSLLILLLSFCFAGEFAFCQPVKVKQADSSIVMFNRFKDDLKKLAKAGFDDTTVIDEIWRKYIMFFSTDSIRGDKKAELVKRGRGEIVNLARFLEERGFDKMVARPLKALPAKSVSERMSAFQRDYSLVVVPANKPEEVLLYILLLPASISRTPEPKILSWKLGFVYGVYFYEDLVGNEGMEAIFEGIGAPKHPLSSQ